jgi:hypothetical protein
MSRPVLSLVLLKKEMPYPSVALTEPVAGAIGGGIRRGEEYQEQR